MSTNMQTEPVAIVIAAAALFNAIITIAGIRLGFSEIEVTLVTTAITGLAAAVARSRVTPVPKG